MACAGWRHSRFLRSTARLALALWAGVWLAACAASPGSTSSASYIDDYAAGRYSEALQGARVASANLQKTRERERAALIAGQSAHALNRTADSERFLRPLTESTDPEIAGSASATLGLIAQDRRLHHEAARHLSVAAAKLRGDEAARAALYAGDSLRAVGKHPEAREMYKRAQSLLESDTNARRLIADRLSGSGTGGTVLGSPTTGGGRYTLQVGAFATRERAQRQADRFSSTAAALGLGSPRISRLSSGGRELFVVQFGRFSSRPTADATRLKLGGGAVVVNAPVP